jgi:hypothetical protein
MRFKVGDKVRVRQWNDMEREFGVNEKGNIAVYLIFTRDMAKYCGKVVTIKSVLKDEYRIGKDKYKIEEDNEEFNWVEEMFDGYAFEYGEMVEVSNTKFQWLQRIYVGYLEVHNSPYIVVSPKSEDDFRQGKSFDIMAYKYARPLNYTVVVNNVTYTVSGTTLQKIKEIINNEGGSYGN